MAPAMQKICVITGSRAEYGLLRPLLSVLHSDPDITLQIVATGMHLSKKFGQTYKQIEADGFSVTAQVEILREGGGDGEADIAAATGTGIKEFIRAFQRLAPDLIVVLGDRYEIFAAATAATFAKIPIGHLHGGELTFGAVDDALRHCITKMSHLHFCSNERYRQRVIQMGEQPDCTFNVGALGAEIIRNGDYLDAADLEADLQLDLQNTQTFLITFHPETLADEPPAHQFQAVLTALEQFHQAQLIFTMPNADAHNQELWDLVDHFVGQNEDLRKSFVSLGSKRYLSLLKETAVVIGNSSSGILEAPLLATPTVNIGDRQKGRLCATSIFHAPCDPKAIASAIHQALKLSKEKIDAVSEAIFPELPTAHLISSHLKTSLPRHIRKSFHDIEMKT